MLNNKIEKLKELMFHVDSYKNDIITREDLNQAFEEILIDELMYELESNEDYKPTDALETIRNIWK
jgi:hypothetical protein|tara:strand:- start:360 stop:557 length:198 start_codon:yes stop_codon:yes gene_type:complete